MPPLFFFLASSFNVELVYIILKGITQFSYLQCNTNGRCEFSNAKAAKLILETDEEGNKTVIMREIKVNNLDKWDQGNNDSKIKDDVPDQDNFDPERIEQIQQFHQKVSQRVEQVAKQLNVKVTFDERKNVLRMQ